MTPSIVYLRNGRHPAGRFMLRAEAVVSPDDRGFVFGDGVYEVVRAYGGRLFRQTEHMGRLARSLDAARIAVRDTHALGGLMHDLLDRNGLADGDAMVYLQITRGEAPRAHPFPRPPVGPTVYMAVSHAPDCRSVQKNGARIVLLSDFRWARCDIKSIALQANVLALQHAKENGADECVFVRDGVVTEGTHTSFFGVVRGIIRTHPATNHILAGITRACVLELCEREGLPCREEALTEMELDGLDEAFLAATSYEVAPVVAISGRPVGDGRPGPIARRLLEGFHGMVRGESPGYTAFRP
ncbi:MAG: hypothetical protein FJX72_01650 [Armatimonadetes bacterium]|nr:hypothetical protein [Armatimonadota bacterium]